MKILYLLITILLFTSINLYCQYDSKYYIQSNYGFKYFQEGEYDKSLQAISLINDTLLRNRDFIVLLNIYNNRDDTVNLKITIDKYSKRDNFCEKIYKIKSLNKYKYLIKYICHNQFDSLYNINYANIQHLILNLDTSIKYSNRLRSDKIYDSFQISNLDKNAYLFLKNLKMKEIASALKYVTQRDYSLYINFYTTLVHLNYYDTNSSIEIENWAKELMNYGIIEPKDYAYLIDRRICVKGNGKQKYGEHFWKYNSQELEKINKNREEIGLLPIN